LQGILEKVTAFVIRRGPNGPELLLFRHPYAGVQLPAGSVDPGESPAAAGLREAREETGLQALNLLRSLGKMEYPLPRDRRAILTDTRVYARPDAGSIDWAHFPRGAMVSLTGHSRAGFSQVVYTEWDRFPDPNYASMQITGWVPKHILADRQLRYFFLLECMEETAPEWEVAIDWHVYRLFWAPVNALPELIESQSAWLEFLPPDLRTR